LIERRGRIGPDVEIRQLQGVPVRVHAIRGILIVVIEIVGNSGAESGHRLCCPLPRVPDFHWHPRGGTRLGQYQVPPNDPCGLRSDEIRRSGASRGPDREPVLRQGPGREVEEQNGLRPTEERLHVPLVEHPIRLPEGEIPQFSRQGLPDAKDAVFDIGIRGQLDEIRHAKR
jgi:hypothetical protein